MVYVGCWDSMNDVYCEITYYLYDGDDCTMSTGDDTRIKTESYSMPYGTADGLGEGIRAYKSLSIPDDGSVNFKFHIFKDLSGGGP